MVEATSVKAINDDTTMKKKGGDGDGSSDDDDKTYNKKCLMAPVLIGVACVLVALIAPLARRGKGGIGSGIGGGGGGPHQQESEQDVKLRNSLQKLLSPISRIGSSYKYTSSIQYQNNLMVNS